MPGEDKARLGANRGRLGETSPGLARRFLDAAEDLTELAAAIFGQGLEQTGVAAAIFIKERALPDLAANEKTEERALPDFGAEKKAGRELSGFPPNILDDGMAETDPRHGFLETGHDVAALAADRRRVQRCEHVLVCRSGTAA